MKVKIYKMDTFNQFEIPCETFDNVESCKVENGYIHIKFDDSMESFGGIHFPIPYGFTRVETSYPLRKDTKS